MVMKGLLVALAALSMIGASGTETKIGAGVTLSEATPIASLVRSPRDFAGKTVRIDGVATAVCEEMGCWMAVAESEQQGAPTVRLQVAHDGAIVFPMSAKGRNVSAEGTFDAIGGADEHGKDAAAEHNQQDPQAVAQFQIKATGAVIK
jgi:hypothetical protein